MNVVPVYFPTAVAGRAAGLPFSFPERQDTFCRPDVTSV